MNDVADEVELCRLSGEGLSILNKYLNVPSDSVVTILIMGSGGFETATPMVGCDDDIAAWEMRICVECDNKRDVKGCSLSIM